MDRVGVGGLLGGAQCTHTSLIMKLQSLLIYFGPASLPVLLGSIPAHAEPIPPSASRDFTLAIVSTPSASIVPDTVKESLAVSKAIDLIVTSLPASAHSSTLTSDVHSASASALLSSTLSLATAGAASIHSTTRARSASQAASSISAGSPSSPISKSQATSTSPPTPSSVDLKSSPAAPENLASRTVSMISLTAAATAGVFIPSSSAPSTPLTSPSVPVLAYAPVNVGTDYGITSLVSAPMPSTTSPAPGSPGQSGLSASTKRMILIVGIFAAAMLTLFVVFISTCLRRRRREKQRRKWEQASVEWGRSTPKQAAPRQYTPPSSWASDTAPRAVAPIHRPSSPQKYPRPPAQYSGLRSPSSATPLISPPPQAVTRLRSPLANGHVLVAEPGSPSPVTPAFSLPPLSPAPLSPLPQTPNSPSGSSAASCGLVPPTPSLGYGWTRPSLVGIHPFSQSSSSAAAEASSSSSAARTERAGSGAGAGANLGPSMNEKSAAALFQLTRGDAPQALHSAPAYREKDGEMQPRARADSESAPPLYEP